MLRVQAVLAGRPWSPAGPKTCALCHLHCLHLPVLESANFTQGTFQVICCVQVFVVFRKTGCIIFLYEVVKIKIINGGWEVTTEVRNVW